MSRQPLPSPPDRPPVLGGLRAEDAAAWERMRAGLRRELGKSVFDSWVSRLTLADASPTALTLRAPTRFIAEWVEETYGDALRGHAARCFDPGRRVLVETMDADEISAADESAQDGAVSRASAVETPNLAGATHASPSPTRAAKPASAGASSASAGRNVAMPVEGPPSIPLDPRFTFDRFVVGKPNELAHAAARRVGEGDGVAFNPLFLYSASGLGKTHLMHAIAWALSASRPEAKVVLLTAEQFMYRFVQALKSRDMIGFKQLFRSVDVLMIDDVQFIAGKDSTQEEFFHTFNALVDQGKQVVISADRNPVDIDRLEDRIKSRLQWGLVADLHPTDYELRLGILQSKAETLAQENAGLEIAPGVLEFLAHRISSNVRVLEGALRRLAAFASLVGRSADLELARECLADILRATDRKVTIEEIQRKVASHYTLRMNDMLSARRSRNVARPRQIAMYLSKSLTSKSLPEIGRRFGGRDHTTVIHACKTIEKLKDTDSQIAEDLELLRRMLEA